MALYVIHRPDQGEPSPARRYDGTMKVVTKRVQEYNRRPFRVQERGVPETLRKFKRRDAALRYYGKLLKAAAIGDVISFRAGDQATEARRVEKPKVALPSQASSWPQVQKDIYNYMVATYGQDVRWGGTCNCRETRQGGSLSDHACCGASDWFPKTTALGDKIVADLKRKFGNAIRYIAWQVSLHYEHFHVATAPSPCSDCA